MNKIEVDEIEEGGRGVFWDFITRPSLIIIDLFL